MKSFLVVITLFISVSVIVQQKATVVMNDFAPAFGKMKGSLTYLDYKSGKPYTMPANIILRANVSNSNELIRTLEYPDEPQANGMDTLLIANGGTSFNGGKLVEKKRLPNGTLQIITEREGVDGNDNKKATIRNTYTVGKNVFSNRKEVHFIGEEKWIERHIYSFRR